MSESEEQNQAPDVHIDTSDTIPAILATELKLRSDEIILSSDVEALHQFRVTLRKVRALISVGTCNTEQQTPLREDIRWLSELTGPARDADVQLMLPETELTLPQAIRDRLETQKSEAYLLIISALKTPRFTEFLTSVAQIKTEDEDTNAEAMQKQIQRLLKKVLKKGPRLNHFSPDEDFHDLRKILKKLRYTFGFYALNSGERKQNKIEKHFKLIQNFLGTFQDLTVKITQHEAHANELIVNPDADRQELFELGIMIGEARKQTEAMKTGFSRVFKKFERVMIRYKPKKEKEKHHQEL